jgi:eukaryotic-like serine/threonine-protein kinase
MVTSAAAPEARIGEVVDGRYRIVQHIASGGMAAVYRAEHVNSHVPFAIKVLHPELSGNAEISARFQREVQACRRVQHPHIVAASDFGRLPDGCLFMVLEYTPGDDLCVVLFRHKPFAQERAVKIALQVSLALIAAHSAGVVHRDLKPDNIMLIARDGDPDYVKVVDFGIAKLPARGQPLTALGSVFGTPEYMAPEQARGTQVDERTDLYTIGIVLYEMLTGATPFAGDNIGQVIMAQLTKAPPALPPTVDPELSELVMQLLSKDPAARPQTAAEVAARLHRILSRLAPAHPVLFTPPVTSFAQQVAAAPAPAPAAAPHAVAPLPAVPAPVPYARPPAAAPLAAASYPAQPPVAVVQATPPAAPQIAGPPAAIPAVAPKPLPSIGGVVALVMVLLLLFAATAGLVYYAFG